ncbi:ADP-dependent glucokinase/phosphofructokinase [Aureimonas sp. AU40]|uniref:ADP-dependent glucokinase/phosphofructokinase n=1 Tax=Aureimonas sp. AU40 TaxID=1637747 RepID=UPI0007808C2D|nr:ADP-dependent glucokinase/phosphofructokinase [Aureimonas sp. AU40]
MRSGEADFWREAYGELALRLPGRAAEAAPVLLGFSAFVDAVVPLHEAAALFAGDAPPGAWALSEELRRRVEDGIGGEIALDWPEGDAWMAESLPHRLRAGGTSLQIANVLALLGTSALLALGDRSPDQLALVHPDVRLAAPGGWRPKHRINVEPGAGKARHWIFETQLGTTIGGVPVRRATRVIVRLAEDGPERDAAFEAQSAIFAHAAGAGAISSLVATPDEAIEETLAHVGAQALLWRRAGLPFLHLELADYGARAHLPRRILAALRGSLTSVGMSWSEWRSVGGGDLGPELKRFALAHDLERVCVHADEWAAALTRADPARERQALMTGCLLAACRARAGEPVLPDTCPPGAAFADPGPDQDLGQGWRLVRCPSPYTDRPRSTVGLGDTFLAGCLLVHAAARSPSRHLTPGELA